MFVQAASPSLFRYVCCNYDTLYSHSSLGNVPQNQFPAGPVHQPVHSQPGYPPSGGQYLPPQGYYHGQPAPNYQVLSPGGSHHTGVPPHQYAGAPVQGSSYQGSV